MPPIVQNPNFNRPAYEIICNTMTQVLNITPEQASEQLLIAHNADKEIRNQEWNDQIRQEQEAEDLGLSQAQEQEEQRAEEERRAAEVES